MTAQHDDITVSLTLSAQQYERLSALVPADRYGQKPPGSDLNYGVEGVIMELIDHAQQAVYRPDAWERGWVCQAMGYDWLENLEIDPDPDRRRYGWTRPKKR